MKQRAEKMLAVCKEQFDACGDLDTAVRDTIFTGLAYLVHSAYDCMAQALEISDTTAYCSFIDNSTADWFRQRGFAEWFCLATANLFTTSRPRILAEPVVVRKGKRRIVTVKTLSA